MEVKRLKSINIRWERYFPLHDDVTQCKNCFRFGHGKNNCSMKARCMKCGDEHLSNQCSKELGNQRICANCQGNHSPLNHNCKSRRDFIENRDAKKYRSGTTRYIPAPAPTTSAWSSRLNWTAPQSAPTTDTPVTILPQPTLHTLQHQPQAQQTLQMQQPLMVQQQQLLFQHIIHPLQQQVEQLQQQINVLQQQILQQHQQVQISLPQEQPVLQQISMVQMQHSEEIQGQLPGQQHKITQHQQLQQHQSLPRKQHSQKKPQPNVSEMKPQHSQPTCSGPSAEAMEIQNETIKTSTRQPAQDKLNRLREQLSVEETAPDMILFTTITRFWKRYQSKIKHLPRDQQITTLVQLIMEALPNGY
uniref:defective chorion-1 protein, FC106 isoform-like n=1 Tax=Anopheles coluzzii TaxID=1518534 RepID=UPI0020FFA1DE|nr:defective chorion-1 protein, FC106 isoform-like [Anopheles coluzzii]